MVDETNWHPTQREALGQARRLATEGLGESTKAHGVTLIVGDGVEIMKKEQDGSPTNGECQKQMCDYRRIDLKLDDFKSLQTAAKEDGAIVVDLEKRQVLCANFIVTNIGPGRSGEGGSRDRAASAIAQQAGGCFVIKVSEDACALSATEKPDAQLDVFLPNRKESVKVPVHRPAQALAGPAAPSHPARLTRQASHREMLLAQLPPIVKQKLDDPSLSLDIEEKIECLSSCVRVGREQAQKAKDRNLLMVIGNTGAGKSTLVNYLAGCQMEMIKRGDAGLTTDKRKKIARVAPSSPVKEVMGIGHDNKSATFLPAVHDDESLGLTYCDCPGFLDNRGAEINIANACNIKQTIAQARSVRVMVLINYHSLESERGRGVKQLAQVCAQAANDKALHPIRVAVLLQSERALAPPVPDSLRPVRR